MADVISDDEWREQGARLFGTKQSHLWRYKCPRCGEVIPSHLRCSQCGFANLQKTDPPLTRVVFFASRIPVFPFYREEVAR